MKLKATVTQSVQQSVDIVEHFSQQKGVPCIDYVVNDHIVARQEIHQQMVGQAFRIINKVYILPEPLIYTDADSVDVSGIKPDTAAGQKYVGWVTPKLVKSK